MERKISIGSIILAVIAIISIFAMSCAPATRQPENPPTAYFMKEITPGIIRVVAQGITGWGTDEIGFGEALGAAVEKIGREYDILEITPIIYKLGYGSATKELFIKVKYKNR